MKTNEQKPDYFTATAEYAKQVALIRKEARAEGARELAERVREVITLPSFETKESLYPDARWQRENYAAKRVVMVLKKVLALLPTKADDTSR